MKRMVTLVVLVAWLLNCAPTLPQYKYHQYKGIYPIVISERVGETIDAEEREQLDLFTEIGEFKEARFFAIKGGGYEIEIVTESQKMHAVNMDPNAVEIMRDYIGRYAEIKGDRASFENTWAIIDYDTLGVPITKDEVGRVLSPGHAVACGTANCLLVAPFAVILLAGVFRGDSDVHGWDVEAAGIFAASIGLGAILGLVTGCGTGCLVYQQDRRNVVNIIKEARKPKVVE